MGGIAEIQNELHWSLAARRVGAAGEDQGTLAPRDRGQSERRAVSTKTARAGAKTSSVRSKGAASSAAMWTGLNGVGVVWAVAVVVVVHILAGILD
jgi:hypothetical protein